MSVSELAIQIRNAPGQLVQITGILAEADISILGVTASSAGKTGWVRLVVDKSKEAEEALEECGIAVETGEAVAVVMPDEMGMLDRALRACADERINIDYIYSCSRGRNGQAMVVIGVQTPGRVEKLLQEAGLSVIL